MAEKKRADVAVAASDLDWVLLRPGTLTDESGSGRVDLNRAVSYGDVSRDNVAARWPNCWRPPPSARRRWNWSMAICLSGRPSPRSNAGKRDRQGWPGAAYAGVL